MALVPITLPDLKGQQLCTVLATMSLRSTAHVIAKVVSYCIQDGCRLSVLLPVRLHAVLVGQTAPEVLPSEAYSATSQRPQAQLVMWYATAGSMQACSQLHIRPLTDVPYPHLRCKANFAGEPDSKQVVIEHTRGICRSILSPTLKLRICIQ